MFHAGMMMLTVIMAFPFLYLIKLSLQPDADVMQLPIKYVPSSLEWGNFTRVLEQVPIGTQLINTLIYAVSTSKIPTC